MINNRLAGLAAFLTLTCAAAPAFAGPFHLTLPVDGLTAAHSDALITALKGKLGKRSVHAPKVSAGSLEFYGGGEGPKSLVRLSSIQAAVKAAGLTTTPATWTLKAQTVGVTVSTAKPMSTADLRKAFAGLAEVSGTLLDRRVLVVVIHLEEPVAFAALTKHLAAHGVTVDDLVWGHWGYGWGFEQKGDHHDDNGATRGKQTE